MNEVIGAGTAQEKKSLLCECVAARKINEETVSLEFNWSGPQPHAGQFFMIKPKRTSVFLARPFAAASWQQGVVGFIVENHGRGSGELMELKPGEKAELIGPLGNTWASFRKDDMPIALISGGAGVAPLGFFAQQLTEADENNFDIYAGFRSESFGLDKVKPHPLVITSEDGFAGQRGLILDFFLPKKYKAVFACGPLAMIQNLADMCKKSDVPCFVSLDKKMACGTGACLGCTIKTKSGNKRCCTDGPVFDAKEINFE